MAVKINGSCDRRFRALRDAFVANFEDGLELGASLALAHRGKTVVDLWAGYADLHRKKPWQRDTIVFVASTTKIIMAVCALMLIDRKKLDLDAPLARYWPEFAAGGKSNVTIRDALTHQAGVPGFDPPIRFSLMRDWPAITARIAAEKHWFGGERVLCYHGHTYGFLLGELMRRVDGRKPARFLREEVTSKTKADFQIGLRSKGELRRLADLENPTGFQPPFPAGSFTEKIWNSVEGREFGWEAMAAEIPSFNGHGNARALARMMAIVAEGGTLGGRRYLSRELVGEMIREQVYETDPFMGPMRFGLGGGLDSPEFPAPSPASVHWGGYGGSWALADPEAHVSFGYAPNNLTLDVSEDGVYGGDRRLKRFTAALRDVIKAL